MYTDLWQPEDKQKFDKPMQIAQNSAQERRKNFPKTYLKVLGFVD